MARVRMLTASAGPLGNRMPGQIVDVSDDEALTLVDARAAVLLDSPREAAMVGGSETAVLPAARGRRRG